MSRVESTWHSLERQMNWRWMLRQQPADVLDKSERFVFRQVARYLIRWMQQSQRLNMPVLEIAIWCLGKERRMFIEDILAQLDEDTRANAERNLRRAGNDCGQIAGTLMEKLDELPVAESQRQLFRLARALVDRRRHLAYGGRSDLERRLVRLNKMFDLDPAEIEVLTFVTILSYHKLVEVFFLSELSCHSFARRNYLAAILDLPRNRLDAVLKGKLRRLNLLELDRHNMSLGEDCCYMLEHPDPKAMPEGLYRRLPAPELALERHPAPVAARDYLLRLLTTPGTEPVHVLLYGPPGTGKTSFSRALARRVGRPAYEICPGAENNPFRRQVAIEACLNLTAAQNALVVVDEADHLLNTGVSFFQRGETADKSWLNSLLERPGARVIWIVNDVAHVEASVQRRFAFSLCFPPFSARQRLALWDTVLGRHGARRRLPVAARRQLAREWDVSAGVIDQAVRQAKRLDVPAGEPFVRAVRQVLDAHLALRQGGEPLPRPETLPEEYSLEGLAVAADLAALLDQLTVWQNAPPRGRPGMRLLFYGPPGTGKSQLARYIARHLRRELQVRRSGDILDPYVGMTERRLAEAFGEAEREDAVLVIDEVDSFLYARARAVRSWEISHTNEFLTRMEAFGGLLVCTTNRFADLDEAAVRRFQHKVRFDYLDGEGNRIFFRKLLLPLLDASGEGIAAGKGESLAGARRRGGAQPKRKEMALPPHLEQELAAMAGLAPGDFRTVRDRFAWQPPGTVDAAVLLAALREEVDHRRRGEGPRAIGFSG